MWQIGMNVPTQGLKQLQQQGCGGDAVNVVITKNNNALFRFAGAEKTFHGGGHVRQKERIGQVLEAGLEKSGGSFGFAQSTVEKALGEESGDFQTARELLGEQRLGLADGPAVFHEGATVFLPQAWTQPGAFPGVSQ